MQHLIHIRDELILEAHLDVDEPHIFSAEKVSQVRSVCISTRCAT